MRGWLAWLTIRDPHLLILLVSSVLHFTMLCQAKPLQSANDRSRWCTVWSLTHRASFIIDEIKARPGWDTIDCVHVDGHFYSTKPPVLSVLAAAVHVLLRPVTRWDLLDDTQAATAAILLVLNWLPWTLSLWLICDVLELWIEDRWSRRFAQLLFAFGTLCTPFVSTLNNHLPAAICVTGALFAYARLTTTKPKRRGPYYALLGFCSTAVVCFELPAAILLAALGAWTFLNAGKYFTRWYLPFALVPLVAMAGLNYAATGSLKPQYAAYGSTAYLYVVDGVPSYWMNPQGLDRNLDSAPVYLLHCLIGHHGLFSLTPAFLLVLLGRRRLEGWPAGRRVFVLAVFAMSAIVLAFYLTRTENYNYGGKSCALRWMIWLSPLWVVLTGLSLDHWSMYPWVRPVAAAALAASIFSAWLPATNPWQSPWIFRAMEQVGWIDYGSEPPKLPDPLYTWIREVPRPSDDPRSPVFIEFAAPNGAGEVRRRRLTVLPPASNPALRDMTLIEIREQEGDRPPATRRLGIKSVALKSGKPPAECVRWVDAVTESQQQADLAWLRGLPSLRQYQAGHVDYLKTSLRKNAFKCQRAAAEVIAKSTEDGLERIHRCDVWLCPTLPFGIAQFDQQTFAASDRSLLQRTRWTVVAASPSPSNDADVPQPPARR